MNLDDLIAPGQGYDDAYFRNLWQSTPGGIDAKLAAIAQVGLGNAGAIQWAAEAGVASPQDLQNSGTGIAVQQAALDSDFGTSFAKKMAQLSGGGAKYGGTALAALSGGAFAAEGLAGLAGGGAAAGATEAGAAAAGATEAAGTAAAEPYFGATAVGATEATPSALEPFFGATSVAPESAAAVGAGPVFGGPEGGAVTNGVMTGGSSGGLGPAATAGAAGAGTGTALSRILDGNAGTADYLSAIGTLGATGLGIYGANQQSNALQDLSNQYMAVGAPSRGRYEASFNPGFSMTSDPGYQDALDQTTKSFLHKASIAGNPADSPNAWQQTLKDVNANFAYPALQDYRRMNANAGGLSRFADAAPGAATGAIGAQKGVYDAIGAGAADIFNPPGKLEDLLRRYKVA